MCDVGAFDVQIEDERAVESEDTKQSVLNLEMARLETAADRSEDEHDGGKGHGSPVVGEKGPGSGRSGERGEIGMKGEQTVIQSRAEIFFPSRADVQGIEIESQAADGEQKAGLRSDVFRMGAERDQRAEVVGKEIDADQQAGKEADAEEDDFFEDNSGEEENFGADEPEIGYVIAGEVRWNGDDHERGAQQAENDEGAATAARDGKLGENEFEGANQEQGDIGEIWLDGLKLQDAEEKKCVEKSGDGGDMLFEIGFDAAQDVGNTERQPVEEQHGDAGVIFGEEAAMRAVGAEDFVKPIEMIEVAGEDAENFELEPTHFQDNGDEADRKDHAGEQSIDGALIGAGRRCRRNFAETERNGCIAEKKGEAGDELGFVAQCVRGHGERHN